MTNTGGAYLYAVRVSDGLAPSCGNPPSSFADMLFMMAPNVTITYSCSLSGVTSSFVNTVVANATTGTAEAVTCHRRCSGDGGRLDAPAISSPGLRRESEAGHRK